MEVKPTDISCQRCHGEQFTVVDETTGLLRCDYCRNLWIDPRFIRLTETERFLQEQAKQPKIVVDNTTETDKQLMEMIGGIASGGLLSSARGCLSGFARTVSIILVVIVLLIIVALVAPHIDWGASWGAATSGNG